MTKLSDPVDLTEMTWGLTFLGIGTISGKWQPNENERKAAWEMYVELITRISVAELQPEEGLMREALSSLYTLFGVTRDILRKYGPVVAQPKEKGHLSFGYLAVAVLNTVLRPFMSRWHPRLLDHETRKPSDKSAMQWETDWEHTKLMRPELEETRKRLLGYAQLLASAAGVPSLVVSPS